MKIDVNNLSVRSLQGLLLLFPDKSDEFASKYEEFYNPSIRKMLKIVNGMPHQLFVPNLLAREIYPEIKKVFLQRKLYCDVGRVFNGTYEDHCLSKKEAKQNLLQGIQ